MGDRQAKKAEMEARLSAALGRHLPGFRKLGSFARLSGGASQETYRLEVETDAGEQTLALRRSAGGVWNDDVAPGRAGIQTEALLMRLAKQAGVPEPEVLADYAEIDFD